MDDLYRVDVPWACFGLVVVDGLVVEAANIASWTTGKAIQEVTRYYESRGGKVEKVGITIVSGGQTGADRAGLDAAIEMGVPYRGWAPAGRRAEDGFIPDRYKLQIAQGGYELRTELNVADSVATVIFTYGPIDGGSRMTYDFCVKQNKPCMWIDLTIPGNYVDPILEFIVQNRARSLNVAGNRESKAPGIYTQVKHIMMVVLANLE